MKLTREQILDVARRHIAKKGYSKLSLVAIARELQVVKGAIYYHVRGGRRELLDAVVEREEARLIAAMRAAASNGSTAREALREALTARIGFMRELVGELHIPEEVLREMQSAGYAANRAFYLEELDLLRELLERGVHGGEFELPASAREISALLQGAIRVVVPDEVYDRKDRTSSLQALLAVLDRTLGA